MNETPEPVEATTPGELLKQARERAGLSVERVAKDLYLDTQVIRTIEVNRFKDLGAPVYAKGYLRKYAKLVGVAEESILQGYQQLCGATAVPDPIPASMGSVPETRKALPGWIWRVVIGVLVLAGLVTLLNLRDKDTETAQQKEVVSQPLPAPEPDTEATAPTDSPLAALPMESAATAPNAMAGAVTLEFKFSGDSWVEVNDSSNRQVLYELGATGNARQIQALPPLRVVLGAANAVSIQVNSRAIAVPAKNIHDGVARFVVKADGSVE